MATRVKTDMHVDAKKLEPKFLKKLEVCVKLSVRIPICVPSGGFLMEWMYAADC